MVNDIAGSTHFLSCHSGAGQPYAARRSDLVPDGSFYSRRIQFSNDDCLSICHFFASNYTSAVKAIFFVIPLLGPKLTSELVAPFAG